jgi:hypothetical protein
MQHVWQKHITSILAIPLVLGVTLGALAMAPASVSAAQRGASSARLASYVKSDTVAVTTTTFLREDPPATSPTVAATFEVNVAAKGTGPAPTGTVSFTWTTTNGNGAKSGPVGSGSATLNGNDNATISGFLPSGGKNGSMVITASYSGDSSNAASTGQVEYFVESDCYQGAWPAVVNGFPNVVAGDPTGYYIGQSNGWFTLLVVNPANSKTTFTGQISTDGLFLDLSGIKNEKHDKVVLRGPGGIHYILNDNGYLDGFTFFAGCGSAISFNKLLIDGVAASTSQVWLGSSDTVATEMPLSFRRTD